MFSKTFGITSWTNKTKSFGRFESHSIWRKTNTAIYKKFKKKNIEPTVIQQSDMVVAVWYTEVALLLQDLDNLL